MVLFTFCKEIPQKKQSSKLEIWEDIQKAVRVKDLDYLMQISQDTLDCIECNNGKSKVTKEVFFNNYIEQMNVPNNKKYSYYIEKININGFHKRYRINYKYKNGNTIFTILVGDDKVKFQGVFSVP